jgi:hypothetical protein
MVTHEKSRFENLQHTLEQPVEMVKEYPVSTMLLVFTVGLGVGALLGQAVVPRFHEPTMSERLSRQIHDAVASVLPQGMARQLPF